MLKIALLLALGAVCVSGYMPHSRTADMDFLHKQKKIYELLFFVKQHDLIDAEFYEIGRSYEIMNNMDMYKDKNVVQEFFYWYKQGMLKRNAIFTPYNEEHLDEMRILFKLFFNAKDFQTFYKTACWARLNINDGVFTSAFTVAVFYRPDCKYMRLPAIYEIYPNLFFDSYIIQEAHNIKMTRGRYPTGLKGSTGMENVDTYMIYSNYSGEFVKPYYDPEYKLDYYMEDVSLNGFYYYFRQVLPFWLNSKEYDISKEFRGQLYYFIHKQLLGRYYLERFSNDLGEIEDFDWYKKFYPGYYSSMMYTNGVGIPQRNRYSMVPYYKYKYLKEVNVLEMRIMNAIDSGYVIDETGKQINIYTPEGLNYLANIIEGNVDSCNKRFYGMYDALARDILGFNFDYQNKNKVIPSSLQCYSTSMRDPAFYMLYKRIMTYFFRYKKYMPAYTQQELQFTGVKFDTVNVDKLVTYFDYCDTLINNAVSVENFKDGMNLRLKTRRYCLNYKPFTYRFNINSEKETKAVLRIFLGPAFDDVYQDMSYTKNFYKYFVEMDKFVVTLRSGINNIERRSSDSYLTMPDLTTGDAFFAKLNKAISGSEPFNYYDKLVGFPERLTLPRGKPEGMKFKMFFYLSYFDETKVAEYEFPMFGKLFYDGKPLGFPLDRPMYYQKFNFPNMFFKDVFIYHTKEEKMNF